MEMVSDCTISTIICAYTEDRWDDLVRAVSSVEQQSKPALEIIVVIDHNEKLWKQARSDFAHAIVIENTYPSGLSGARNSGVDIARGDLIAFLDDDAIADRDWLAWLSTECQKPEILGVGGTVQPAWPEKDAPSWFPSEFSWVVGCSYRGMPEHAGPIRNPIGANMCIKRGVFSAVGGFRSEIGRVGTRPVGCEETEFCIRARQHWPECTFLYQPQASVSHRVTPQRTRWKYFRSRCYAEGISKAFVSRYVGTKDTLSAESSYTLHTLPEGVTRNLKAALTNKDTAGYARAGAIIAGLIITTAGYVVGSCFSRKTEGEQFKGNKR